MRSRARGGTYLPTYPVGERGVRRNDEWCGVRGAIDSSFNLVATHPSARPESCRGGRRWRWRWRRRRERTEAKETKEKEKKDLRDGRVSRGWREGRRRGARGMLSYLFECVVARDKNESTESMWRPPPFPHRHHVNSKSSGEKGSWKGGKGDFWRERERERRKGDARVCTHLDAKAEMIFMYLLIECRHHRRLLRALSFHVKSSLVSRWGG